MQAMDMVRESETKGIVEMHGRTTRNHVDICASQKLQPFGYEISNSHFEDSGVGLKCA
jgi:hypothetical protein